MTEITQEGGRSIIRPYRGTHMAEGELAVYPWDKGRYVYVQSYGPRGGRRDTLMLSRREAFALRIALGQVLQQKQGA